MCVPVARDYILPRYTNITTFDLVLSGPSYDWNLGLFLYTLAGTLRQNCKRSLPLSYGINVNMPRITSSINNSCANPSLIQARPTGDAEIDYPAYNYNETTGLFSTKFQLSHARISA